MEALLIGVTVGFVCSVGFLGLGYTLGVHTHSTEGEEKAAEYKNKVIDKLIDELRGMKDMTDQKQEIEDDSTEKH